MSTPFPLEEQGQLERIEPTWDPWKGPPPPHWYSGMGFTEDNGYIGPFNTMLQGGQTMAAKGVGVLAGAMHGLVAPVAQAVEERKLPGASTLEAIEQSTARIQQDARYQVKRLTPDPATTGWATQLLHSLSETVTGLAAGAATGGGAVAGGAVLGVTEGGSRFQELKEQGVDTRTAIGGGLLTGITSAAGALTPIGLGATLTSKLLTGAAANTAFGVGNRYLDHRLLEISGYQDMADQQKVWDSTQVLTDMVLGAAFGGVAHLHARSAESFGVQDAALTANLALRDRALAPGVPTDPQAAGAHQAALEQATADLLSGRRVDVSDTGIDQANFVPRPRFADPVAAKLVADSLKGAGILEEEASLRKLEESLGARLRGEKPAPETLATRIPRLAAELTGAQRGIETRFAEDLASNPTGAEERYNAIPDTKGGKVINTDLARELSPDYMADRTQSAAVHEPASWLMKRVYERKLAEAPGPGQENTVLFTAGGTGAGKSTAVKGALGDLEARAQIVYDTNLSNAKTAIKKIGQALAAGKDVKIAYVHRDAVESFTAGALKRAKRQEAEFGSGRTVPIEDHVDTHVGANKAIHEVAAHYAGDPRVEISVIDNSRGPGKAGIISLEQLPKVDYTSTREQVLQALQNEFEAGRVSAAIYRGFAGIEPGAAHTESVTSRADTAAGEPAAVGAGSRGEPQPQRPAERTDQLETVSTATGRRIEVRPKLVEAADLLTSDRKGYPQELQPRQRGGRIALQEQVRSIAQNLEPERLGTSAEADRGAPITGEANVVESGNGRVMALRDVYANNPEKAAAYRAFLESQGYDLAGMKEPVLVRERVTPLEPAERRAFTVEANQAATAALSPVERAQADARLLDAGALSQLRNGEIASGQNAPFVRAFLEGVPQSERNALVNPDGTVSQEGVRRVQAAILAKAYGGAPESNATLGRMLESTDSDMRSALGALLDAAPAFARLRQAIEEGKLGPEYDLSRALTQAIEETAKLRGAGQALNEFLKQQDFLTQRAPVVDALMKALYDKKGERLAPRDKIAQRLMNYADQALKQRLDQGMLFGDAPLPPEALLEEPKETIAEMKPATDMFGLRAPQAREPAAQAADQALAANPHLEIVDENGEANRARSELLAADEAVEKTEARAPPALDAAAACAGRRAAA